MNTEADVVSAALAHLSPSQHRSMLLVEVGCGLSTVPLADFVYAHDNARLICVDLDSRVTDLLKERLDPDGRIVFCNERSTAAMKRLHEAGDPIHFAFFDGEPCAWTNFTDFSLIEPLLRPGSVFVMDNAAEPGREARVPAGEARKGRIIAPYLLAAPRWSVQFHKDAAGGMLTAVRTDRPVHWHPDYSLRGRPQEYAIAKPRLTKYKKLLPQRGSSNE